MRQILLMTFISVFWVMPAMADQIDGDWCGVDGKRLSINGPQIIIPSGKQITGDYTRHEFVYTGPDGDPEMGETIRMVQQSDELMLLYRSTAPDDAEQWRRCQLVS